MTQKTLDNFVKTLMANSKDAYKHFERIGKQKIDMVIFCMAVVSRYGYVEQIVQFTCDTLKIHNILTVEGFTNQTTVDYITRRADEAYEKVTQ